MSNTVDILCFHEHLQIQLLKVKHAFNLETLIDVGTKIAQITQIGSHLKLRIAVARHNFEWLKIEISQLSTLRVKATSHDWRHKVTQYPENIYLNL